MPPHYSISSAGDFHPEMPGSKDEQDGYDLGRNTENPGWGQHAHNEGVGKDHLCAHLGKDCATDVVKDRKPFDDHAKEVAGEKNNGNAHAKSEEEQEKVSWDAPATASILSKDMVMLAITRIFTAWPVLEIPSSTDVAPVLRTRRVTAR